LTVDLRRAPSWTLVAAAGCTALFLVLAVLVMLGVTRAGDLAVIRAFQSVTSYPLDLAVNAHTVLGQLAVTLPLSVVLAIVAQRRLGGYAWLGPLFILATGGIEIVFKTIAEHPAPPREFTRAFGSPLGVPPQLQPPFAFPSGHVARSTFLAVTAAWLLPSRASAVLATLFIAFTVFARVYIGDHWISDAVAGLALGAGVGALAIAWMRAAGRR
jgi:membrane-associated phospholipid phosphatase